MPQRHPLSALKTAIVYDQATTPYGGAELVLTQLKKIFPSAPLFTLMCDQKKAVWAKDWTAHTSSLQWLYQLVHKQEWLAPLMPHAIENLSTQLTPYQLIISVSAGAAKGVITNPNQLHICYLLTPTRYLHEPASEYLNSYSSHSVLQKIGITKPIFNYLRRWDIIAAQRPDHIIAISRAVALRIKATYGRDSTDLVYPPIPDLPASKREKAPSSSYYICLSRLVWYKRTDLAIQAAAQTNRELLIVGSGSAQKSLQQLVPQLTYSRNTDESINQALDQARQSSKSIIFLNNCTDQEKVQLVSQANALIMPGIEDYGLTPVEAASYGIPSIIHQQSGVAEVLRTPKLACHVAEQTVQAVIDAMFALENNSPSAQNLQAVAKRFLPQVFQENIENTVYQLWRKHSKLHTCYNPIIRK